MWKRIEALPALMDKAGAQIREEWELGKRDEIIKRDSAKAIATSSARIERAERAGHRPTIGAAWYLLASDFTHKCMLNPEDKCEEDLVSASRKAVEFWPEGGFESSLQQVLLLVAELKVSKQNESFRKTWNANWRIHGSTVVAHKAAEVSPETRESLKKMPEIQESIALLRETPPDQLDLHDWLLAHLLGDADLERAAAASIFSRPKVELQLRIAAKLSAGAPRETTNLDLYLKGKAAK